MDQLILSLLWDFLGSLPENMLVLLEPIKKPSVRYSFIERVLKQTLLN